MEDDFKEQNHKSASQLKDLRMKKINIDAECNQIPERIISTQKDLTEFEDKLKEFRDKELEEITISLGKIDTELENLRREKKALTAKYKTDTENLKKIFENKKSDSIKERDSKEVMLKKQLKDKQEETDRRKNELTALMDAELKGLGVDTEQLS